MELLRISENKQLLRLFKSFNCVAILGPRQCGKTTLAKQFAKSYKQVTFLDLENPIDLLKLDNPELFINSCKGYLIIDEIQRKPDLFPILRVILDKKDLQLKILILGSASRDLIQQSSETLAGRIAYMELGGLGIKHIKPEMIQKNWIRGTFPKSFLARTESDSVLWRKNYISTFLERDIPNLGINIPARTLRQFWTMLAHVHGQTFVASEIGENFGVSHTTIKKYADILAGTYMIRILQPWFINTNKRIKKTPKIYFRDTGILHTILGLDSFEELSGHPKLGLSWEAYALEQFVELMNLEEVYYWGLHSGAEIDLVYPAKGKLYGVEFKYADAPAITPSIKSAIENLELESVTVIYPGKENFQIDKNVFVKGLQSFSSIKD